LSLGFFPSDDLIDWYVPVTNVGDIDTRHVLVLLDEPFFSRPLLMRLTEF